MKYIYIENNKLNGAGECKQLDDKIQNIEISEKIYTEFLNDNLTYIFKENKIIPNPNYEEEKKKRENSAKIIEIQEKLEDLDKKRIRAVCENEIKNNETNETWLEYYNQQINNLRREMNLLKSQI